MVSKLEVNWGGRGSAWGLILREHRAIYISRAQRLHRGWDCGSCKLCPPSWRPLVCQRGRLKDIKGP